MQTRFTDKKAWGDDRGGTIKQWWESDFSKKEEWAKRVKKWRQEWQNVTWYTWREYPGEGSAPMGPDVTVQQRGGESVGTGGGKKSGDGVIRFCLRRSYAQGAGCSENG